jgi:glycosyltransferase involved in cell wall biosynthesis
MPNVGVMELHTDSENIYNEASLARHCNTNVTIFTTEVLYKRVLHSFNNDKDNYTWVLQKHGESLQGFLKRIEKYCNERIDLLLVNTFNVLPHHQFFYYLFRPQCKTIHVVGRIEWFFGERPPIRYLPVKQFILSVLSNMSQFFRTRTLPHFDGIWVENSDAYNYAICAGYQNKIACLPFQYCRENVLSKEYRDELRFVVIGSLCDARRDYQGLLDVFETLFDSGRRDITLTLLGAPFDSKGFRIINRCRKLVEKGLDITCYTAYIPEAIVREKILSSDIIVNPGIVSTYGTGTCGPIVKAIQFAKPGIYTLHSLHHEELMSSSLFYNNIEELPGIIENLLDNPEILERLSTNALANSEKFSFDIVANKFKESVLKSHLIDF